MNKGYLQVHTQNTFVVAFHPEKFRVSLFIIQPLGMQVKV
jgi:hypothetical protein